MLSLILNKVKSKPKTPELNIKEYLEFIKHNNETTAEVLKALTEKKIYQQTIYMYNMDDIDNCNMSIEEKITFLNRVIRLAKQKRKILVGERDGKKE